MKTEAAMNRNRAVMTLMLCLAGAALLSACSEAKSEPLEVTYYYLPG